MKPLLKLATIAFCLAGLTSCLMAAPSTLLPNEWFVVMEDSNEIALVDRDTGQARFLGFDGSGSLIQYGPYLSQLPDVTGLSSGFVHDGAEYIILSSKNANRLAFMAIKETPRYFSASVPGPENAFPFNSTGNPDNPILISSLLGNDGQGLELINQPLSGSSQLDLIDGLNPLNNAVPLLDPFTGVRMAVTGYDIGTPNSVLELFRSGNSIDGTVKAGAFPVGSTLVSQVIGSDGRICTIAFVPGEPTAAVFTHSFGGFTESMATTLPFGFNIGTIAPIPYGGIPNASDGVLITSDDGTEAVYARLVPDVPVATEFLFDIVEGFNPTNSDLFTGFLPVPGQGFVAFQGGVDRRSMNWRYFTNTGSGWNEISSGELSPWLTDPIPDFATLFWYSGTPMVNPAAELLQLDIVPDWTLGGGALPASLEKETFVNSAVGLDNPTAFSGSGPTGATHVMTSQVDVNTSVASMADIYTMTIPSLRASPESGTYNTAVVFNLVFDEDTVEAFYRRSTDVSWIPYTGPVTIGYPTELLFYAKDLSTGTLGPIGNRNFDFSVDLNGIDSDKDGVPDYVEEYIGLDPFGGADTDLDFQSDLEEILGYETAPAVYADTDPNDPLSNIPADDRSPPYFGEGFYLYTQAFDSSTGFAAPYDDGGTPTTPPASDPPSDADIAQQATDRADDTPGTNLYAYDMRSTLLTRSQVDTISSGSLAGEYAARLDVTSSLPDREWLILSTPTYFGLGDTLPAPRDGRESFRILQNPAVEPPAIVAPPTGSDLVADAQAWIDAARAAYSSFDPVTSITRIDPLDTIIAVLGEQVLFEALQTLDSTEKAELGVPAEVADWTLFAARDGEASKVACTQDMLNALLKDGCDFEAMLQVIDSEVRASGTLPALANAIYDRHVAVSDTNPLMALPLDAWRSILREGAITDPAPGSPERTDPYETIPAEDIGDARVDMLAIQELALATKRPTEQWTLIVEAPSTPGHLYDYRRLSNDNLAWLIDASGERFIFEQGLGLNLGTTYTVTGYTDVVPVAGFDTMEIISINSIVTPQATDSDTNANLLDDDWEKFFFGQLGAVSPFDPHPDTGHTYLQYQVAGADPRSGDLSEPVYDMLPTDIDIVWQGDLINAFDILFTFPDAYVDAFDFSIESSTTLELDSFVGPAENGALSYLGVDRYSLRLTVPESNLDKNFFRIVMSLKEDP